MPTVGDVLNAIDTIAPPRYSFPFDKIGLQLGDPSWHVESAVVSLDWSTGLCEFMEAKEAQLVVCHHPLIWEPLAAITPQSRSGQIALRMLAKSQAFIACHTNWDSVIGGVNDALAAKIGLQNVECFGSAAEVKQYKLVTFAPKEYAENIVNALSHAGAGQIGLYEHCAFLSPGEGTFRPMEGSSPTIGEVGQIEKVDEIRIEILMRAELKNKVLHTLRAAHPYEEPAFDLHPVEGLHEQPAGRIGELIPPMSLSDFNRKVENDLDTKSLVWGDPHRVITRVALVGGAADGEWRSALTAGADAYLTGEVRQNVALDASEAGIAILSAGHYATEQPGMEALCKRFSEALPNIRWHLFEPKAGMSGRPE